MMPAALDDTVAQSLEPKGPKECDDDRTPAIRSVPKGDETQLRQLISTHHSVVWRTLRNLGVLDADLDDAIQQVFIVAARKLDCIQPGRERAFLVGVSVRIASRERRVRQRRREVPEPPPNDPAATRTPAEELDRAEAHQLFQTMLANLSVELRSVLVMYEVEELTLAEIADALGLPIGTVNYRLRRARELVVIQARRIEAAISFEGGRR